MKIDERYMRRALQLARCGIGGASPNPMVGAVIVDDHGSIIGEGYHRRCGEGHAEVNAVASVRNRDLFGRSTIYVTLEPCSHYGKTPPCAKLIIDSGIPRVVVGCLDPFAKVSGRGVAMLREAGVEVSVGVLEHECMALNRRFMTAHSLHRPFVTLKWAQSADGYMDRRRSRDEMPYRFSTILGQTLVHRLRSLHDAITVGTGTVAMDRPRLDVRCWPGGRKPLKVVNSRSCSVPEEYDALILDKPDIQSFLTELYDRGVTSLLVEGGAVLLRSYIASRIWDEIRVEVSPARLGKDGGAAAPEIECVSRNIGPRCVEQLGRNMVLYYSNPDTPGVKNL